VPYQFAVRITCPSCGHPDAQLRVAFPFREAHRNKTPVVALFYCVNASDEAHDLPADDELLAGVPDLAGVILRAPWWDHELSG
jgi:hypothetical protein